MSRFALLTALFCFAPSAFAQEGHQHAPAAKAPAPAVAAAQTWTGEVMDLACYLQHPETGQGAGHAACAAECITNGLPAGLKVGDQLFLLMGKGHDSVASKLAPLAGKQTKVTGRLVESGGLKTIVLEEIVPATP